MTRKPLGHAELRNSEWAKHLKKYGKQLVNAGQRRDGKTEIREVLKEGEDDQSGNAELGQCDQRPKLR